MNESVNERQARLGRNESVFRAVNDEIEALNQAFASVDEVEFGIVCECGDMSCAEQIQIQSAEYARVRTDPTLFFLVPGHEDLTVEGVAEAHQDYVVVKKPSGSPAGIAADSTPAA
jgi:hypothetical protein